VLVLLIPGLHKVKVIDHLWADGAVAAPDHNDLSGSVLEGCAHVLHCEGAHTHDDDALATPVDVRQRIGSTICHDALELLLARHGQGPRQTHPVVDAEDHASASCHCSCGRGANSILEQDVVVTGAAQDFDNLDLREDVALQTLTELRKVPKHLGSRAVVAIVAVLATLLADELLQAIATLRTVHLRCAIRVHGPNAPDKRTLLEDCDGEAGIEAALRCDHPEKAGSDDHDIDLLRRWPAARQHQASLVEAGAGHGRITDSLGNICCCPTRN